MTKKLIVSTVSTITFATLLILWNSNPAFAVSTITISSSGDGVFLLQGIGIEDAAALEINVSYDTATLANPRVAEGPLVAGAMTAVNPNVPGAVRIVMIRLAPIRGSGVIATLTFDRTGAAPGRISGLSARLANANGAPLAALVQVNNPPDAPANAYASQDQNVPSGSSPAQASAATAGSQAATSPVVIIAGQPAKPDAAGEQADAPQQGEPDTQSTAQISDPSQEKEPAVVARTFNSSAGVKARPAPEKTDLHKIYRQKSVLELFRDYKGERTADALFALFGQESMIGCRQEPAVALSDGKSVVKFVFISTPGDLTTSDIAVMGARLISLRRDADNTNTWIVELLPEKGGYQASIAVSLGGLMMIYPLTIAPKIDIDLAASGKVTKADFDRYLQRRRAALSTPTGANNDGGRDYIDDYIYAVNYLALHHLSTR